MQDVIERAMESSVIFMDAWGALAEGCAAYESRRGGLIDVSWMGHPFAFTNLAVTARPHESIAELSEAVVPIAARAEERRIPWLLVLADDLMGNQLTQAGAALEALGFTFAMKLTGMETDELVAPVRPLPQAPILTEDDPEGGGKMLRLNELAYQLVFAPPGSLPWELPGWWHAPERLATVLERDGIPASSAVVVNACNLRYVGFVATHPDLQRQGYAEAAMRNALDRASAAGLEQRIYLHATAVGLPVYRRMGFRVTAEFTVYMKVPAIAS